MRPRDESGTPALSVDSYLQATRLAQDRIAQVDAAITALKAENEAYRASVEADLARKFDDRRERLLLSSVQTLESLDEAVQAARAGGASDALLQGVMLVRTQLYRLLTEEGLQRISVLGLPFDARTSVVAGKTPVDEESQDGLVVQEVRSGQQLDGRVVRKARVVVGSYAPEAVPEAPEEYPTLIGVRAELSVPPGQMAREGSADATLIGSPPLAEAEPEALEHAEEPEATMIVRAPLASRATPPEEPPSAPPPPAPGRPELEPEYANADPSATMPFLRVRRKPPEPAAVPPPSPPTPAPPEEATMIGAGPLPEAPEAETPEVTSAMPAVTQAMPTLTDAETPEVTRAMPIVIPPSAGTPLAPPSPPTPAPPVVWTRDEPRPSAPPPAPPRPAAPSFVAPPPVSAEPIAVEEEIAAPPPATSRPRRGLYIALALGIVLLLIVFVIEVRLLLRPAPQASPEVAEAPTAAPAATPAPLVAEGPPVTAAPPAPVDLPPVIVPVPPATMPVPTLVARPTPTPGAATPRPDPSPVRAIPSPRAAAVPTPAAPATVAPPPNPSVALMAQADRAAAAENFDEAVRLYDQALQVDPKNSDAAAGRLRAMIARDARRTFTTAPTRVETASAGKGLSGFEGVKVTKAPKHSGKIEFEVSPRIPLSGEPYTVAVHLANTGDKGFKVASLSVVTTVNGSAATQTVAPRVREVSEGRRALVAEVPGVWREGTTTWSMSVTLAAPGGETFRSQLSWR